MVLTECHILNLSERSAGTAGVGFATVIEHEAPL